MWYLGSFVPIWVNVSSTVSAFSALIKKKSLYGCDIDEPCAIGHPGAKCRAVATRSWRYMVWAVMYAKDLDRNAFCIGLNHQVRIICINIIIFAAKSDVFKIQVDIKRDHAGKQLQSKRAGDRRINCYAK
jgi:hypothetical protein